MIKQVENTQQKLGEWAVATSMVVDNTMNNGFQIDDLINKWKTEERKRKIGIILRDYIKELEQENSDLKKQVKSLKNIMNNNE